MEHLNNLPPFYIGQKVVYITGKNMPKGTIDTIIDIKPNWCSCCPYVLLLKDNKVDDDFRDCSNVECECCGEIVPLEKHLTIRFFWFSTSFRPLQEQTFPLISMKKVLEEQLVCSN